MERKTAETLLDTFAWMSVVIDKLGQDLEHVKDLEEKKALTSYFEGLLHSFYSLKDDIGFKYPELHPDYLGLESFSKLRKKYESSDVKVRMPTEQEIDEAAKLWQKIEKLNGSKSVI